MTTDLASQPSDSATARAYRTIERMVVTLELAPGSVTTEGALVATTGLGRTPVREAMQRLAWEGLVEIRPRAGVAISPIHASDWLKVIDARRGLEALLARSAARYVSREGAARFKDAALAMQRSVVHGNVVAYLEADKALDEAIAAAADNVFAARLVAPLQTHSRRFWFRFQADSGLAAAAEGHVALIKAIVDGDEQGAAEAAETLMTLLRGNAETASAR